MRNFLPRGESRSFTGRRSARARARARARAAARTQGGTGTVGGEGRGGAWGSAACAAAARCPLHTDRPPASAELAGRSLPTRPTDPTDPPLYRASTSFRPAAQYGPSAPKHSAAYASDSCGTSGIVLHSSTGWCGKARQRHAHMAMTSCNGIGIQNPRVGLCAACKPPATPLAPPPFSTGAAAGHAAGVAWGEGPKPWAQRGLNPGRAQRGLNPGHSPTRNATDAAYALRWLRLGPPAC